MSITIKGNIGEGDFLPWINSTSKEGFLEHLHTSNGPPLSKWQFMNVSFTTSIWKWRQSFNNHAYKPEKRELHLLGQFRIPSCIVHTADTLSPCYFTEPHSLWAQDPCLDVTFMSLKNMCLCNLITHPPPAQIVRHSMGFQKGLFHQLSSLDWFESKKWWKREPEWTLVANVTGCGHLEAGQRGTGANLISCGPDWQALLSPSAQHGFSRSKRVEVGVGVGLFSAHVCFTTIAYQNLHGYLLLLSLQDHVKKKKNSHDFLSKFFPFLSLLHKNQWD